MFAVMKTGGKQYKVSSGDVLRVEKLAADAGEKVQFNDILMLGGDKTVVGTPLVAGAAVQAEVIDQVKGEKLIHFVKRRRKHGSQRTKGHRQQLTLLQVTEILAEGADKSGVKAAVGAGILPRAKDGERFAKNRDDQSEMDRRVKTGEAQEKSAAAKSAPKAGPAPAAKAETAPAPKAKPAQASEGKDDLKQLSGVGPAMEKKLNEAGVTTYAQIAGWTQADLEALDDSLSAKAEKEGWIDQAKDLTK